MLHHLILFLAPEAAAQATMTSPPAVARSARRLPFVSRGNWRLVLAVFADALGLLLLIAGSWLALRLLEALLGQL